MNNFIDGLECIKKKLNKIEDELQYTKSFKNDLVREKIEIEYELSKINANESSMLEFYENIYKLSKFYETEYINLLNIFENELKTLYLEFYDSKMDIYRNGNMKNYEDILNKYILNKKLVIENLINKISSKVVDISKIFECIVNIKTINKEFLMEIITSENLFKMMICYIYIDLVKWNPFSKYKNLSNETINDCELSSIDKKNEFISKNNFNCIIYIEKILLDEDVTNLFNEILIEFKVKINNEILNKYLYEIIELYWIPIFTLETDNLIHSISSLDNIFSFRTKEIEQTIIKKFLNVFNDFFLNSNVNLNEYQTVINLFNWSISLFLFINKFKVGNNSKKEILDNTIIKYIKDINYIFSDNNKIKHIIFDIQINIPKLIKLFKDNQLLEKTTYLHEKLREDKVIIYQDETKIFDEESMYYIYKDINDNITNYSLNYFDEYYNIIGIIKIILEKNTI